MTLDNLMEIAKWTILAAQSIAMLSILIGIVSPLFSPIGRRSIHWVELGFEVLKYAIPAGVIYTIINMI